MPKGPSLDPSTKRLAVQVEDHPLEYGGFEGAIPKGEYGGGTVLLWDRGAWIPDSDPSEGMRKGHLRFTMAGEKLRGRWQLVRTARAAGDKPRWLLLKSADEHARSAPYDIAAERPESVLRPRRAPPKLWRSRPKARRRRLPPLEGSVPAPMPAALAPQLATLAESPPAGDDWLHEIKFDGYRILAFVRGGKVLLRSRNGLDWTGKFPEIAAELAALDLPDCLLDGEAVVLDDRGISNFQSLQNRLGAGGKGGRLLYQVFDLLYLDGRDLRRVALSLRKRALRGLLARGRLARYTDHIAGHGPSFLEASCAAQLEGVVSKRADSPYVSGRGRGWLKVKCDKRQDCVIVGFTEPAGAREGFGALVLAVREPGGALRHVGRAGTGFTEQTLRELWARLSALEQREAPVVNPPSGPAGRGIHWIRPRLVAELRYGEITKDGVLRHPVYLGLREDKAPASAVPESPKLSNPQRVLFPEIGLTKAGLAAYYEKIGERIVPELARRPLALLRCPAGREGHCFFQKHPHDGFPPAVKSAPITEKGETRASIFVEDLEGLLGVIQMGALELHPWGSRIETLETPDRLVFDLDPGPGVAWDELREAARELRVWLERLGLESFLKSTGGKGLHLVLPILPERSWDEAKSFCKSVAESLARERPQRYTAKLSKSARGGKIFIDYLRNGRGATAVAAYSTRARPNAPVAAPLSWDELARVERADQFTVENLPARLARLKRDPWERIASVRQRLPRSPG